MKTKRKMSEEHKRKIGLANKGNAGCGWRKGKKYVRNSEVYKKQSESLKKAYENGLMPWMKGKHHTEESNQKNREAHIGKVVWNTGIKLSDEYCKKLSEAQKRSANNSGRFKKGHMPYITYHTEEVKRKMRLARIEEISKNKFNGNQVIPSWSEIACQKIDEYGKQYNYNFQHAKNGGEYFIKELGYWVDGYDKEQNTVIEYYEKYHEKQVQKDLNRETEICNHLGCDFIIIYE